MSEVVKERRCGHDAHIWKKGTRIGVSVDVVAGAPDVYGSTCSNLNVGEAEKLLRDTASGR